MNTRKTSTLFVLFLIIFMLFFTNIVIGINYKTNETFKNLKENNNKSLNIKRGDIVFRYVDEDVMPFWAFLMHPLVFTGEIIEDATSSGDSYKFIEARGDPDPVNCTVKYTYYSEHSIFNLSAFCSVFCRVKGTSEQVENAVKFMEWRIGDKLKGVWEKPLKEFNPERDNTWYCTEIIWAAYMNCNFSPGSGVYGRGVDIGGVGQIITSDDIINSPNVEQISLFSEPLVKKVTNTKIRFLDIFENIAESFNFKKFNIFKIF